MQNTNLTKIHRHKIVGKTIQTNTIKIAVKISSKNIDKIYTFIKLYQLIVGHC